MSYLCVGWVCYGVGVCDGWVDMVEKDLCLGRCTLCGVGG